MLINITVVTWNRLRLTRLSLESLLAHTRENVIVHVVDNGSTDGTADWLRECASRHSKVRLFLLPTNMGVAVAANLGWAAAPAADYYLKLDNDMIILQPDWLDMLFSLAERNPEIGMLGYQVYDRYKTERITLPGGDTFITSDCVGGACVLSPRRIHEQFGFWNEDYGRYGFEDLEYGVRLHQGGWRIGYVDAPGRVEHAGYAEGAVDAAAERSKNSFVARETTGKKLYVLNRFLFESGIRPLYVSRKYLPDVSGERIRFRSDPAYRAVIKLQQEYLRKISFTEEENNIRLDLTRVRTQPDACADR